MQHLRLYQHETEKDQLIVELKAQLKEMEEKSRQKLEKKDVQLQEILSKANEHKSLPSEEIGDKGHGLIEKESKVIETTPEIEKPTHAIHVVSPPEVRSMVKRLKMKERTRTEKEEYEYQAPLKKIRAPQAKTKGNNIKQRGKAVMDENKPISVPELKLPKKLTFNRSCKVWHRLSSTVQSQIKLINNTCQGYVKIHIHLYVRVLHLKLPQICMIMQFQKYLNITWCLL